MPEHRRLRVAHIITRMIVGGAQETVLLAASLADRSRFEPVVVCGPQTGTEGSLHGEVRRRGIELVVLPELVRQVAPITDLRAVLALARELHRLAPDVVHTNSSKAGIVGRVAARRAGVARVLHTVHGWPFHDHQSAAVQRIWQELERRAAPLADRLIVVADADREKGLAVGIGRPEQYVTVRSGVELSDYERSPRDAVEVRAEMGWVAGTPLVGAINRLSPQKDPLTLVDAFAVVARRRPDVRFLIAGDGPLRPQVEARIAELGLGDRIALAGLRDDVPRLLRALDVFVSASRWEGLPRTIVAAMASGVPVVATPADGVVDVLRDGDSGVLAPVEDADGVGQAVLRLLDDAELRVRVVEGAAGRVKEFDARRMVRDLEQLYDGAAPG